MGGLELLPLDFIYWMAGLPAAHLIPILEQIFPVMDPTNGDVQEEFDSCFSNWIGKADWERWILLVRENLTNLTSEEAEFLRSILGWLETALNYTDVIVVESNL